MCAEIWFSVGHVFTFEQLLEYRVMTCYYADRSITTTECFVVYSLRNHTRARAGGSIYVAV